MNARTTPTTYLSTSGGMWRCISGGLPINANTPDLNRVLACCRSYRIDTAALHAEVWDGDAGNWTRLTPELIKAKAELIR